MNDNISRRDLFAGLAMQSILTNNELYQAALQTAENEFGSPYKAVEHAAYAYADAMIAYNNKTRKDG